MTWAASPSSVLVAMATSLPAVTRPASAAAILPALSGRPTVRIVTSAPVWRATSTARSTALWAVGEPSDATRILRYGTGADPSGARGGLRVAAVPGAGVG